MPRPKDRKKLRKNREKRKVTYKETRFEITDFLSIKIKQKKKYIFRFFKNSLHNEYFLKLKLK